MNRKKITQITTLLLSLLVVISACGASSQQEDMIAKGVAGYPEAAMEAPMAAAPAELDSRAYEQSYNTASPAAQERIVIQNVDMGIVVPDPASKMDQVAAMAERFGGYVVTRYTYQNTLQSGLVVPEGSMSVRVPAEHLEEALTQIKEGVTETRYENRDGQDVTDRYVDLQSQLKAKLAAEQKLYEIMDQADTAEETLMVFNQLQMVQSDIEVLKGQINYYEQSAALSAISISISADVSIQPIEVGGWEIRGEAKQAVEALIRFFQSFVTFVVWFVIYILPVLLVILFFVWALWKVFGGMIRKLFKRKEKTPEEGAK